MAVAEHNVTPQRSRSVIIKISRDWDSGLLQTARLQPRGSVAALLSYELDPSLVDSGMPPIVAEAFGRALPQFGMIAGYWFDHTPPEGDVLSLNFWTEARNGKMPPPPRLTERQRWEAGPAT
jgi:hypothetical protein